MSFSAVTSFLWFMLTTEFSLGTMTLNQGDHQINPSFGSKHRGPRPPCQLCWSQHQMHQGWILLVHPTRPNQFHHQGLGLIDSKTKPVPAKVLLCLHAFMDEPPFDLNFNYRLAIRKLNYLARRTRPDIMCATHQIAKYTSGPRKTHGEALLYLV